MAAQDTAKRGQVSDMNAAAESTQGTFGLPKGAMMEADLQAHIGRQLRAVYDEVVNEPVPDRFLELLEELARKKSEEA
jgi:hypothetical protein